MDNKLEIQLTAEKADALKGLVDLLDRAKEHNIALLSLLKEQQSAVERFLTENAALAQRIASYVPNATFLIKEIDKVSRPLKELLGKGDLDDHTI